MHVFSVADSSKIKSKIFFKMLQDLNQSFKMDNERQKEKRQYTAFPELSVQAILML